MERLEREWQILLIYKRNRRGPKIEPWGTPEETGEESEEKQL